ncbi:MAG: hypothetical protein GX112_04500 [Clostridiaceae bacterium]|jgi:hypothetical protein|nr:hypothetical protein [Clostridiaceae bacterium]
MAKCKCCGTKGFIIETDVNGLCSACAPYYYLTMPDDLKELDKIIRALERINQAEAALGRLDSARMLLERLRPYAEAGLVQLPRPLHELEAWLDEQQADWQEDA